MVCGTPETIGLPEDFYLTNYTRVRRFDLGLISVV